MKKLLLAGTAALLLNPGGQPARAQVSIHVNIPLPPPLLLPAPPEVVVLPESEVYVVPDVREDLFFFGGWWWRPWQGRWYRSHYYDRGWAYYERVPVFYRGVPPGWREDYHAHRWGGGRWDYERIHHDDLQRNWRSWHENRHWEQPQFRQHEFHRDGRPYEGHAAPDRSRRPEPVRPDRSQPRPEPVRPDRPQPRPETAPRRSEENRGRGPVEHENRGRGPAPAPERAPARSAPPAPERSREHVEHPREDRSREERPHGRP